MQDIIQGQKEEFNKYIFNYFCEFIEEKGDEFAKGYLLNWHTSSIKQILQALIEREENRLKECEQCDNHEIHDTDSWNEAKQDTITHLKQLLDSLQ